MKRHTRITLPISPRCILLNVTLDIWFAFRWNSKDLSVEAIVMIGSPVFGDRDAPIVVPSNATAVSSMDPLERTMIRKENPDECRSFTILSTTGGQGPAISELLLRKGRECRQVTVGITNPLHFITNDNQKV